MTSITLQEAHAKLPDIVHGLPPGQEIVIVENNLPVAKLIGQTVTKSGLRPPPGLGKGLITVLADDDEHLKDFEEYMP